MSNSNSNSARPNLKFFVYAPDDTEEGTFAKRLSIRNEHLARMKTILAAGTIRVGGVLLSPESLSAPPEGQKMIGSTFICEAESLDEVKKMVEEDIYYKEGVWDKEKIVVLPMMAATPIP
ncbi:hypothetical protein EV368DRAFT_52298 [Lentinula lateritia]|uniref:Uncharacterized protein n=1 Tax=Lentinula aff. lateritia TaxID=2804960 RepID=A0ACC1U1W1_9AGAR|nr:hypothetical protein F5876DRAFT_41505 [Lentinula aff. lateritia]KAJ3846768.1 hypothetical protein EV368DRAFT_52298 [Lentinula lateritia]